MEATTQPPSCLARLTQSYRNALRTRRPPTTSTTPKPSTQRAAPPPVLGSTPLRPSAILAGTPPPLLPEPAPLEPALLGPLPPEPLSLPEPPEPPLHSSGVGLISGQSSTGKETLAENVLSPSSFTVPKSFITSILPSLSCTIRTGSDTGSTLGGTGLGPGPNLSTIVLPV